MAVSVLTIGDPPLDVKLRRMARARRLTLRVGRDGPVLTVPQRLPDAAAQSFLAEQEPWLRDRLEAAPNRRVVADGAPIEVEGAARTIRIAKVRAPRFDGDDDLLVPGPDGKVGGQVQAFLKTFARTRLVAASDGYARTLGVRFTGITLRDPKSRWGSCSDKGNLMFSWRLAMAPPEILDYVAAHEVAHLREFNHSRYFWRIVQDICPDYAYHRAWLKEHGAQLHAVRFE